MRWISFVVLAGCYQAATEAPCTTNCSAQDPTCPDGQSCGSDFRCHATGAAACSTQPSDCLATGLPMVGAYCPTDDGVDVTLGDANFSTGNPASCTEIRQQAPGVNAPSVCIVYGHDIRVETLVVGGPNALVLVAKDTVTINTLLDVSGVQPTTSDPGRTGPGGGLCIDSIGGTGQVGQGTGGGAGGGFQFAGGMGGMGASGDGGNPSAAMAAPPTFLRGGCNGGNDTDGGRAGGAVYIVAGNQITLIGEVRANGAGGTAFAGPGTGGGGGASGGMIALEAPTIDFAGRARALGGGGAAGDGGAPGQSGTDGGDGGAAASGGGGAGGTTATSYRGDAGDPGTFALAGGGGGGGGGGFILMLHIKADLTISPNAEPVALKP